MTWRRSHLAAITLAGWLAGGAVAPGQAAEANVTTWRPQIATDLYVATLATKLDLNTKGLAAEAAEQERFEPGIGPPAMPPVLPRHLYPASGRGVRRSHRDRGEPPPPGMTNEKPPPGEGTEGDIDGIFAVLVVFSSPGTVTVEIRCDEFMEPARLTVPFSKSGARRLQPGNQWKVAALYQLKIAQPAVITTRLLDARGRELGRQDDVAIFHPMTECPPSPLGSDEGSRVEGAEPSFVPGLEKLQLYADPQHPLVRALLQQAVDRGFIGEFRGAAGWTVAARFEEVAAVWRLLETKGYRFNRVADLRSRIPGERGYHVRPLDQAVPDETAGVLDGGVLLKSIFEYLGFQATLNVLGPRCLLLVRPVPGGPVLSLDPEMLGRGNTIDEVLTAADAIRQRELPAYLRGTLGYGTVVWDYMSRPSGSGSKILPWDYVRRDTSAP